MRQVKIIGLGGIGSWLAKAVAPILYYGERQPTLLSLIDGDKYEPKNHNRQAFKLSDSMSYKAEAQHAELAEFESPKLFIQAHNEFINHDNVSDYVCCDDIVLLCVDNHATRKTVSDHCATLRNVTLISGGNDYDDGNVQVYVRKNGRNKTANLTTYHPEIANPTDRPPDEVGCEQAIAQGETQTLTANFMCASIMLCLLQGALKDELPKICEVYFTTIKPTVSSVARKS
ncbi:MAG: ThiF family adenylyltransferase [Candidatus Micrarchaeota archaeon]|nr:ThiF family adenylyltransferase [Candidatus Micrarchaeota archaeon]